MSAKQLKEFLEAVMGDTTLQEKVEAAKDIDSIVQIAKEAGFAISAEEVKQLQADPSDQELGGIAGGLTTIDHLRDFGTAIFT